MLDDLSALEDWAHGLLAHIAPAEQRKAAKAVGMALRRSQAQRIGRQLDPDGSPYAPRQRKLRGKSGRIKRAAMFAKLKKAGRLKTGVQGNTATVGFSGSDARIARVHQEGRADKVSKTGPTVRYPKRVLLGFSEADRALIRDTLIDHLSK